MSYEHITKKKKTCYAIGYCQKYESERRILIQNLAKIKMQFMLGYILQNNLGNITNL